MDYEQAAAVLAQTPLFGGLPRPVLERLAADGAQRTYARGQFLLYQGDPGDRLYVILSGLAKVVVSSDHGEEMVLVTVGPPEMLGELALIDGGPRSASVQAMEPTTALMLTRDTVLGLLQEHPALVTALLGLLGGVVRRLTEQAADLVFLDLHSRVAKLLLRLAEDRGAPTDGGVALDLNLTQTDLARMVGGSRPAVNRILQTFASRGYLEIQRNAPGGPRIVVRELAALRRRAER